MAIELPPAGRVPEVPGELPPLRELPARLETLPDGREAIVLGDVARHAETVHRQGDNARGYQGTCGLVSIEGVLRQFGFDVTEAAVVEYAADHGLCQTDGRPEDCGGTTVFDQVLLLRDFGLTAFVDAGDSVARLAARVEEGRGVIAEVNAGVLWDRADFYSDGSVNHAVVVTGTARDPRTGELLGVYLNDSGVPDAGRFVDARTMQAAFADAGGLCVCTDAVRRPDTPGTVAPVPHRDGHGPRFPL